jgi:hypothetical protein
MASGLTLS